MRSNWQLIQVYTPNLYSQNITLSVYRNPLKDLGCFGEGESQTMSGHVKKQAFYLEMRLPVLSTPEHKQVMTWHGLRQRLRSGGVFSVLRIYDFTAGNYLHALSTVFLVLAMYTWYSVISVPFLRLRSYYSFKLTLHISLSHSIHWCYLLTTPHSKWIYVRNSSRWLETMCL